MDFLENIEDVHNELDESALTQSCDDTAYMTNEFCDEHVLEDITTSAIQEFFEADEVRQPPYGQASLEQREQYLKEFYNKFNELTGYSNNLHFREGMEPNNLGAFNPVTKQIELNADLLLENDPQTVMETIMHESRHAYQDFAINNPEQVSVEKETLNLWEHNFNNYISPEFDFEAYVNQPVEADANDFSERMFSEGFCNAA